MPLTLTGEPCVRCPPWASTMPSTLSSGSSASRNAPNTAMFAVRAGVGLHVRVVGAEQRLGAIDRELLGDVDELAPAVVAAARVALGVLVVHRRADRGQHGRARVVLRGDEAQLRAFALQLVRRAPRRPPGRWPSAPPSRRRTPCSLISAAPLVRSTRSAPVAARAGRLRTGGRATRGRSPARRRARSTRAPMLRTLASLCSRDELRRGTGHGRAPRGPRAPCSRRSAHPGPSHPSRSRGRLARCRRAWRPRRRSAG